MPTDVFRISLVQNERTIPLFEDVNNLIDCASDPEYMSLINLQEE